MGERISDAAAAAAESTCTSRRLRTLSVSSSKSIGETSCVPALGALSVGSAISETSGGNGSSSDLGARGVRAALLKKRPLSGDAATATGTPPMTCLLEGCLLEEGMHDEGGSGGGSKDSSMCCVTPRGGSQRKVLPPPLLSPSTPNPERGGIEGSDSISTVVLTHSAPPQHSPVTPVTPPPPPPSRATVASPGHANSLGPPRSPRSPASSHRLRRTMSTHMSTHRVENNVRRLVEYFVIVSSLRCATSTAVDTRAVSLDNSNDVEGRDVAAGRDATQGIVECPPSPAPTSSPSQKPSGDLICQSPKVLRRIQTRRVHFPEVGGGDAIDGATSSSSLMAMPDLDASKRDLESSSRIHDCTTLQMPILNQNISCAASKFDDSSEDGAFEEEIIGMYPSCDSDEPSAPPLTSSDESSAAAGASENIRMPGGAAGGNRGSTNCNSSGDESVGIGKASFEPRVTSRFPLEDYLDSPLDENAVAQFCNPSSEAIKLIEYRMPHVHHFVLTNSSGKKIYGTCLTIYEEYKPPANVTQKAVLYLPRMLCLLSSWPYLTAFREYLTQVYRKAVSTDLMTAPIERYILNICCEVPCPPPGAYEIQLNILDSCIRFWAPPAKQPIAYVALPFEILFECLDISNVLFVWYSLSLERKILLVSSQTSLLTVCAEILCSLLFPCSWSHLYIPTVPRFLTRMLDAPFPYLCGLSRENFQFAIADVSDEALVVDLDRNVLTCGNAFPQLPAMPQRRRLKIEDTLEQHVEEVFWNARGLTKMEVDKLRNSKKTDAGEKLEKLLDGAEHTWAWRLKGFDEAFNLCYTPDSYNNLNDEPLPSNISMTQSQSKEDGSETNQSRYDAVQEAFLRFFVSALKNYRRFLVLGVAIDGTVSGNESTTKWSGRPTFDAEAFVASARSDFRPFLEEFVASQMFDDFITKRLYSPGEPDVTFFDQSIDEKKNRSKLNISKTETPFLQSARSHKSLKIVQAVEPSSNDLPSRSTDEVVERPSSSVESSVARHGERFIYSGWPERLKTELFGLARPIPQMITAEFDRQAAIVAKIRSNYIDYDDEDANEFWELYASECDPSHQVASFTVFFLLFSAVVGRELQNVDEKRKKLNLDRTIYDPISASSRAVDQVAKDLQDQGYARGDDQEEPLLFSIFSRDWSADMCCSFSDISNFQDLFANVLSTMNPDDKFKEIEDNEKLKKRRSIEEEESNHHNRFDELALFTAQLEEARAITHAQLNLAFDTLDMMRERLLLADPDVYKFLMESCGRCGDAERATYLMEIVQKEGLVADCEMYNAFVNAFSTNPGHFNYLQHDEKKRHRGSTPSLVPFLSLKSIPRKHSHEKSRKDFIENVNAALSMSSEGSSFKSGSDGSHSASTATPSGTELNVAIKESAVLQKRRLRNKSVVPILNQEKVPEAVATHVTLGTSLLNLLYPNIRIDTDSDSCPKCSQILSEEDVTSGWVPCAFKNYTTGCPKCQHRFVPHFSVSCSSPSFEGSQGIGTPLYCELLSPWVLRKELHNILRQDNGINTILHPEWRSKSDINATLWWNIILCFGRENLPSSFLLQGSFKNRLILPAPIKD